MGELRVDAAAHRDDVADGRHIRHRRAVQVIDLDVSLLHRDAGFLDAEARSYRSSSCRNEKKIRAQLLRPAIGRLRLDVHAVGPGSGFRHLRPGERLDALLLERLLQLRRDRLVLDWHQPRQQLDDGDLAAEAPVDRRELDADRAAAHDDERLRHVLQPDRLVARDDPRAIDLDARDAARRRARRDDYLLRLERLLLALDDVHLPLAGKMRRPLDPVDLVLLEEELDPPGEAGDDAILARLDLVHVDRGRGGGKRDTPFLCVANHLERVRVLEQRLRGDAAPNQAGAPKRFLLLDNGNFLPELRAADCGDVPTGTGADDHHVVGVGHEDSLSLQRCERNERVSPPRSFRVRLLRRRLLAREPLKLNAQFAVLVLQLPVVLGQLLEAPGGAPRLGERGERKHERGASDEPEEGDHTTVQASRYRRKFGGVKKPRYYTRGPDALAPENRHHR